MEQCYSTLRPPVKGQNHRSPSTRWRAEAAFVAVIPCIRPVHYRSRANMMAPGRRHARRWRQTAARQPVGARIEDVAPGERPLPDGAHRRLCGWGRPTRRGGEAPRVGGSTILARACEGQPNG